MTRVVLIATSAVVRAGLESILNSGPNLEVVGSGTTLSALPDEVERLDPDVILVQLDRRREPGTGPMGPVPGSRPAPPAFVLLSDDPSGDGVAEALRLGAHAVLPHDAEPAEIIAAVEAAAAGLIVLHLARADSLLSLLPRTQRATPDATTETLTPREIEVLGMLAEGAGNKQIARRLGISEHTVKFHVGSILGKLGAGSRTEAVTIGVRHGLIMV